MKVSSRKEEDGSAGWEGGGRAATQVSAEREAARTEVGPSSRGS